MKIFLHKWDNRIILVSGFRVDYAMRDRLDADIWTKEYLPSHGIYFTCFQDTGYFVIGSGVLLEYYDEIGDL